MKSLEALVPRSKWLPFYNVRKVGDQHLLTNRKGDWDLLDEDELQALHSVFMEKSLFERLSKRRLIISADNQSSIVGEWIDYNDGFYSGPYLHIVHLTQRCNLGCSYCHSSAIPVDAVGRDLSVSMAVKIAEFILKSPCERIHVNFQGGEPTLMLPVLIEMLDILISGCEELGKSFGASITTNGTILDASTIELLRKYKVSITVSLDGPESLHDYHRPQRDGSGSYSQAVAGKKKVAEIAPELGGSSILVLSRKSLPYIRDIVTQYIEFGQSYIHLKPMTKLGSAKSSWQDNGLDFEEYWEAYKIALDEIFKAQSAGIRISELSLDLMLEKIIGRRNTTYVDFRNPCGLVYGVLNYDIDGKIYGCHEGKRNKEFLIGDASEDPQELILSKKAADLAAESVLDRNPICRSCAYIAYCAPCPASSYQQNRSTKIEPFVDFHCKFTLALCDLVFEILKTNPETLLAPWRRKLLTRVLAA